MADKCPKCGAEMVTYDTMGSYPTPVAEHQIDGPACQLVAANARIAELEAENKQRRTTILGFLAFENSHEHVPAGMEQVWFDWTERLAEAAKEGE